MKPYGSFYLPEHLGSGGGNGGGRGGQGGGKMFWRNGQQLLVDGAVRVMGGDGVGENAGGGAGGSIIVQTLNFTGFGIVDVSGGIGAGVGGGGAGGRVSVQIAFANKFAGRLRSVGGSGSGDLPGGAAGTVYVEESNRGPQYADIKYDKHLNKTYVVAQHRRIEVDNEDLDAAMYAGHVEPWLYTMLNEGETDYYEFNEGLLTRHANLFIDYPDGGDHVTVKIDKFYGDRTGLVHLKDRQTLYVEYQESVANETRAPCSFRVDAGAEIFLPESVDLIGTRTYLGGRITGVEDLFITGGSHVVFLSSAQTALIENGTYVMMTTPGNFTFTHVIVERRSLAEFSQIVGVMSISCADLIVKYEGELFMNDADIYSTNAIIESRGTFHMNGAGYAAESGPGAGATLADGTGTGAGHGGWGGSPVYVYGGVPYNSVYTPLLPGSGGGRLCIK